MTGRITGTGSFVPEINISNEELSEIVDTSDAWIYSRTGIRSRRIAGKETVAEMGAEAARRAMEKAGLCRGDRAFNCGNLLRRVSFSKHCLPDTKGDRRQAGSCL